VFPYRRKKKKKKENGGNGDHQSDPHTTHMLVSFTVKGWWPGEKKKYCVIWSHSVFIIFHSL
jgi:hypothetical protein